MQTPRSARPVELPARPEPVAIDLSRTALVVVDAQNAFMSPGGLFDQSDLPIAGAQAVIAPSRRLLVGIRAAGVAVVYLKMSYNADMSNAGGPDSPNWHKETGMVLMRKRAGAWGKFVTEGTWDEQIVGELAPVAGEPVVRKQRYSGFAGTSLDHVLKTLGAKYLLFMGGATNICVGSTLMDAFFLDYWPILVEDACYSQCPAVAVEGAIWNIENLFGWVTTIAHVLATLNEVDDHHLGPNGAT
jgi:ureidoacrylate peracid hydrolase